MFPVRLWHFVNMRLLCCLFLMLSRLWWGAFLMLLLIAEYNFTKKEIFAARFFPVNLPKTTTTKTLQKFNLQGYIEFFQ